MALFPLSRSQQTQEPLFEKNLLALETPFVNHQKLEITFHKDLHGRVMCNYSEQGILIKKDIPLVIDSHYAPPLSSYTITYYRAENVFVCGSYGLKGGMQPGNDETKAPESAINTGSGIQNFGDMYIGGNLTTGDTFHGLTPTQILELSEKKELEPLTKNPTERLPQPLDDFVGRGTLLSSLEQLLISKSYVRGKPSLIQILQGPPGIGKSELAIQFANKYSEKFCKIWVIHAETSLELDYQNLAQSLKIFVEPGEPLAKTQNKVHTTLERLAAYTQKPYLLIFDNVEDPFTLDLRGGALLLTARSQEIYEDKQAYLEVLPFTFDDVKALYTRRFKSDPPKELEELLQESEGFPLVIRAILSTVSHPTGFKEIFQESRDNKTIRDHTDKRYQGKLGAVFETLLKSFEKKNPEAYQLLQIISHFSPDNIPLSLVQLYGSSQGLTKTETWKLIEALTSSFIRYTDGKRNAFAIHRITQDTSKALQQDSAVYTQALSLLAKFSEGFDKDKKETWEIGQAVEIHCASLQKSALWEKGDGSTKWTLLSRVGKYWYLMGAYEKALETYQKAYLLAVQTHGEKHRSAAKSCNSVGNALRGLGKYTEALKYNQEALELMQALFGEKHRDVAKGYNDTGYTLGELGQHALALEYQQKALALRVELLGEKHPLVARGYNNVGATLGALGKHAQALEYQQKALALWIELFGEKHPDVAIGYNNVGLSLGELGKHTQALEHQQKSLALWIELFGEKHPDVARGYNNVGLSLGALGKHAQALEHKQKALALWIELFGEKHPDVARGYNNVGATLGALGKHAQTLEHTKKALALLIELFGEKHPDVATGYNNVGSTLGALGKHAQALEHKQKALALLIELFGEKHPHVAMCYNQVGSTLGALGQHTQALEHKQKALALLIELFGEKHPHVAMCYNQVGSTLGALGKHAQALEHKQKALALWIEFFGEKHPDVAMGYNQVGSTLGALGQHTQALEYNQKALALWIEFFGEKHPDVARGYNQVGSTLGALGQHTQALEYQQKALALMRELFGEKHPDVAMGYNNVGLSLGELGKHAQALEHTQKALALWIELFGKKHPDVARGYNNVGHTLGALGQHPQALKYQQKALALWIELFGEKHPHVATGYNNVGSTLGKLGQHTQALEHTLKAFSIACEVFQEQHPNHTLYLNKLIFHLGKQLDKEIVEQTKQRALLLCIKKFGENHELTLKLKNSEKNTVEKQKNLSAPQKERALEKSHFSTVASYGSINAAPPPVNSDVENSAQTSSKSESDPLLRHEKEKMQPPSSKPEGHGCCGCSIQ